MTKLPSHHHLWARASNSTRASILVRRNAAASQLHHHAHQARQRSRALTIEAAAPASAAQADGAATSRSNWVSSDRYNELPDANEPFEAVHGPSQSAGSSRLSAHSMKRTASAEDAPTTTTTTYALPIASAFMEPALPTYASSSASPSPYRLTPGPLSLAEMNDATASSTPSTARGSPRVESRDAMQPPYTVPRPIPISLPIARSPKPRRSLWIANGPSGQCLGPTRPPHPAWSSSAMSFSTTASFRASPSQLSATWGPDMGGMPVPSSGSADPINFFSPSDTSLATLSRFEAQVDAHGRPLSGWNDGAVRSWNTASASNSAASLDVDATDALVSSFEAMLRMPPAAQPPLWSTPSSSLFEYIPTQQQGYSSGLWTAATPIGVHLAASSSYDGVGGGSNSSGNQGSSNANGSGSSSSSLPPALASAANSNNSSPSPTPNPGSSTILNNHNNTSSQPTPFPFPPSRTTHTNLYVYSLEQYSPASTPKPYTLSHQSDISPSTTAFEFRHGAYGIPKRHPRAVSGAGPAKPGSKGKSPASATPSAPNASRAMGGTRGMLAAAADFLAGSPASPPPPPPLPRQNAESSPSASSSTCKKLDPDALRSVQVGEDAYFLRPDSLGVADGVGGWATRPGANPAMFSRLLMHFCSVELSRYDHLPTEANPAASNPEELQKYWDVDPVEVMQRAWERCVRVSRHEGILGSSTALLAMLRGDELRVANLGDCVLLIVRQGELLFRSQEQQHSFNFPVQLGMMVRRGTRDIEDLMKALSSGKDATLGGPDAELAASQEDEDYDTVEDEAKVQEHARRLEKAAAQALGLQQDSEAEEKRREREALLRRAEQEGRDLKEVEAELEAAQDFDFDVNGGGGPRTTPSKISTLTSSNAVSRCEDDEDEDRGTVYVGFDDAHPWDEPRRDCGRWKIKVQKGDIIIVASDGLVDNLFDDEILEEVQRFAPPPRRFSAGNEAEPAFDGHRADAFDKPHAERRNSGDSGVDMSMPSADGEAGAQNGHGHASDASSRLDREWSPLQSQPYPPPDFSPQLLSEALCSRAKAISQDSKAIVSPFQQRATEEGLHYVGGKHDDISVLVAVVGEREHGHDASHEPNHERDQQHASDGQSRLELRGGR